MTQNPGELRLADLVEHEGRLDAEQSLEAAATVFKETQRRFLGVTQAGRFVGLVSRREITQLLSLQFGHALFGRKPVREHLMPEPLVVTPATPLKDLLKLFAARDRQSFYYDIALISADEEFLGLIPVHRLARLQTSLLLDNLATVEEQRTELANRHRRLELDLRMAREVQLALLPNQTTRLRVGDCTIETHHHYEAAEHLGGDFFAVFSPEPASLFCGVFDVMGHGVRPALVTAILRALLEEARPLARDPGVLFTQLNRSLQNVLRSVDATLFVTAVGVTVDLAGERFRLAQAGHPTPLHWQAPRRVAQPVALREAEAGPALGLLDEFDFLTVSVPFARGDMLLLFTDGIVEAASPSGEEFGPDRLNAAFAAAAGRFAVEPAAEVVEAARRFAGASTFTDDACAIILRRTT